MSTSTSGGRRVLGWIFLVLGAVLILNTLLRLPAALQKATQAGGSFGLGYAVGSVLFGALGVWLVLLGQRWRRAG